MTGRMMRSAALFILPYASACVILSARAIDWLMARLDSRESGQRPGGTDDTKFLQLATRAQAAQAAYVASIERWSDTIHIPPEIKAEHDRLFVAADTLRRQALSLPARAAVGLRAKARMVLDTIGLDGDDVLPPGDQDFPAWSLARDLLGIWA